MLLQGVSISLYIYCLLYSFCIRAQASNPSFTILNLSYFLLRFLINHFCSPFMALSTFARVTPHLRKESCLRSYVYLVSWVKIGFLVDDKISILFHILQISPNYLKPSICCLAIQSGIGLKCTNCSQAH